MMPSGPVEETGSGSNSKSSVFCLSAFRLHRMNPPWKLWNHNKVNNLSIYIVFSVFFFVLAMKSQIVSRDSGMFILMTPRDDWYLGDTQLWERAQEIIKITTEQVSPHTEFSKTQHGEKRVAGHIRTEAVSGVLRLPRRRRFLWRVTSCQ